VLRDFVVAQGIEAVNEASLCLGDVDLLNGVFHLADNVQGGADALFELWTPISAFPTELIPRFGYELKMQAFPVGFEPP